jgi:hypothetical protein
MDVKDLYKYALRALHTNGAVVDKSIVPSVAFIPYVILWNQTPMLEVNGVEECDVRLAAHLSDVDAISVRCKCHYANITDIAGRRITETYASCPSVDNGIAHIHSIDGMITMDFKYMPVVQKEIIARAALARYLRDNKLLRYSVSIESPIKDSPEQGLDNPKEWYERWVGSVRISNSVDRVLVQMYSYYEPKDDLDFFLNAKVMSGTLYGTYTWVPDVEKMIVNPAKKEYKSYVKKYRK